MKFKVGVVKFLEPKASTTVDSITNLCLIGVYLFVMGDTFSKTLSAPYLEVTDSNNSLVRPEPPEKPTIVV